MAPVVVPLLDEEPDEPPLEVVEPEDPEPDEPEPEPVDPEVPDPEVPEPEVSEPDEPDPVEPEPEEFPDESVDDPEPDPPPVEESVEPPVVPLVESPAPPLVPPVESPVVEPLESPVEPPVEPPVDPVEPESVDPESVGLLESVPVESVPVEFLSVVLPCPVPLSAGLFLSSLPGTESLVRLGVWVVPTKSRTTESVPSPWVTSMMTPAVAATAISALTMATAMAMRFCFTLEGSAADEADTWPPASTPPRARRPDAEASPTTLRGVVAPAVPTGVITAVLSCTAVPCSVSPDAPRPAS